MNSLFHVFLVMLFKCFLYYYEVHPYSFEQNIVEITSSFICRWELRRVQPQTWGNCMYFRSLQYGWVTGSEQLFSAFVLLATHFDQINFFHMCNDYINNKTCKCTCDFPIYFNVGERLLALTTLPVLPSYSCNQQLYRNFWPITLSIICYTKWIYFMSVSGDVCLYSQNSLMPLKMELPPVDSAEATSYLRCPSLLCSRACITQCEKQPTHLIWILLY